MRWIRMFDEGSADQKDLLGGKGANLAEMTRMGLPVPPGFTITTEACRAYLESDGRLPDGLLAELDEGIARIEQDLSRRLGEAASPLLLSVRSGAKFSMPGMMDTVLNLGLNRDTRKGLAEHGGDGFAADAYRRFLEMYGRIVQGVPGEVFEQVRHPILVAHGAEDAADLDVAALHELGVRYEHAIESHTGLAFPADPREQLARAVESVFRSWNGQRARDYRRFERISDDLGTAVNVQAMVFGNAGPDSGTGVAFTRDPATGENRPYGDFLVNAQGEDVVAGVRNTLPLEVLEQHFPACAAQLTTVFERLEQRYRDMCDIEFTIESGRLFILQTRVGKRSAEASLRIAVAMVDEGLIDEATAVLRFTPQQLERLLHPRFDPRSVYEVLTTGLGASPGAASGHVAFTADDAAARASAGAAIILVRPETSPDDLHGIIAAQGILTSRGGLVSHAAVVARGMGKPAVCGAAALDVDVEHRRLLVDGIAVNDGDVVSIDGTTGEVVVGEVDVVAPHPPAELDRLLSWADGFRYLGVRANADTADDARRARGFGAEGIGLCRTEHQFLGEQLPLVQRAILAEDEAEEAAALDGLHAAQLADFTTLLEAMDGLPVTVRLLDPPLHEFLPHIEELVVADARGELDDHGQRLLHAARAWQEDNPMLGVRGVRLGLLKPAIYRIQVRSLLEAAAERICAGGAPRVQIMIPLVSAVGELEHALALVADEAARLRAESGVAVEYHVGTMIETPRAALLAGELAPLCDFLSFGTNDLTQMTFGFSRDDVEGRIMGRYIEDGILPHDPFGSIDVAGVGELMRLATEAATEAADVEIGICGEHGGDPASIAFCHRLGLDYVSCSPFRVRVARLAAAHVALGEGSEDRDR